MSASRAAVGTVLATLLADARAHRLQAATTLAGVAVGIAVIVAIRLASVAALDQFRGTFDSLTGVATHQLTAADGLDPARLLSLRVDPAVRAVHPVVAATVLVPRGARAGDGLVVHAGDVGAPASLRLVGVDPFQAAPFLELPPGGATGSWGAELFTRLLVEPGLVLLGRGTAAELGVAEGEALGLAIPGGRREVTVALLDEPRFDGASPPFALTDLATAQELLGLGDRVLRYDLVLDGDGSTLVLSPGERLEPAEARGERADSLTDAFATNLMCLGLLAVLVGSFVVFSMAQFAVSRRRALLGRLRCLGCPARSLFTALLAEAAVLGLVGGLLGLLGGAVLARFLVDDLARSVGTLYGPVGGVPAPALDLLTVALGLALAVGASVGATWAPARSAAATPPVAVAGVGATERTPAPWVPAGLLGAAALLLLPEASAVVLPSCAVLAVLLAAATAIPRLLGRLVAGVTSPPLLALACGQIERSLGRTGATAGALAMPVAMTLAVTVMVGSFRQEVMAWSEAVLGADVYVKPLWFELAPERARLPPGLVAALESEPDVLAVDCLRVTDVATEDGFFLVAGARLDMLRQRRSLRVLAGGTLDDLVTALDGGAALVSEALARRQGLAPGSTLALPGLAGAESLQVAGVFQDFSLDRGYALLAEPAFRRLFGERPEQNAAVMLAPGADAEALVARWSQQHPEAVFRSVGRLRQDVAQAFDDTFAITDVLQSISATLALLGVLTGLLCLHIERRQELGVLRALGASLPVVGGLLLLEALILTGVAVLVALPTGVGLSWILVDVINTRSFGWSFPLRVDVLALLAVPALAVLAGLAAALVPWLLVLGSRVAALVEPSR